MIGQQLSLEHLMPIALELLEKDPLAEGDFHPGDLLCNVVKADAGYYIANPQQRATVKSLLDRALILVEANEVAKSALFEARSDFQR